MASPRLLKVLSWLALPLLGSPDILFAQVSSPAVDANGMALSQNAAIEQSRLFEETPAISARSTVTADGMALPVDDAADAEDVSFGIQQILKEQPKIREWAITGDGSVFFTNNAALTRDGTVSDMFFVTNAALTWTKQLSPAIQLHIGTRVGAFRYADTPELDFYHLGFAAGLSWVPDVRLGIGVFGRYDFTELLDRDGQELLREHQFTLGLQRSFPLGRAHGVTLAVFGAAGIADPRSSQRQHVAATIGYQLALTRSIAADIGYRVGPSFYRGGRTDLTHVLSAGAAYRVAPWASLAAFLSLGVNDSNYDAFDYDVFTLGGGLGLQIRF